MQKIKQGHHRQYLRVLYFNALFAMFRMLIGASSILYLLDKGLQEAEIITVKMVQFAFIALVDVPLSYWADSKSKKLSILLAVFAAALWLFLTALAKEKFLIYIAEFFNALSLACFGGAAIALLIQVYRATHGEHAPIQELLGRHEKLSKAAMIAGIIICGFVPYHLLDYLWFSAALLCAVLGIFGLFFLPRDPDARRGSFEMQRLKRELRILAGIYLRPRMISVVVLNIAIFASFAIIVNYNQIAVLYYLPAFNIPMVHTGVFCVILLMQAAAGFFAERFHIRQQIVLGILLAIYALLFSLALHGALAMSLFIANYFFIRLLGIKSESEIQEVAPTRLRASIASCSSSLGMATASLGALLIGASYTSIRTVYIGIFCLCVLSLAATVLEGVTRSTN